MIFLGRRAWADEKPLLDEGLVTALALENNPQVGMAAKRVEQAKARVREASSGKAPVLSASALYQKTFHEPQYPLVTNDPSLVGYANAGFRETWKTALSLPGLSGGAVEAASAPPSSPLKPSGPNRKGPARSWSTRPGVPSSNSRGPGPGPL